MKTLLELLEKNGNRPFERINVTYYGFDGHKVATRCYSWSQGMGWSGQDEGGGRLLLNSMHQSRPCLRFSIPFNHMVIFSKKNRLTWSITVTNINEPKMRKRLCK